MNQKTIMSIFGITLLLFLSLNLVSAAVDFYPSTLKDTANSNSEINLQFKIYNEHTATLTDIQANLPSLISGFEEISASNLKLTGLPSSIENKTNSSLITLNIKIPELQKSGTYTGDLEIEGKYSSSVGPYKLPIEITINETPSLEISQTKSLTLSQNGTIKIKNTGNTELTNIELTSSGDFNINFSKTAISSISPGDSVLVNISSDNLEEVDLKTNYATITATASDDTSDSIQIPFTGSFCRYGDVGSSLFYIDRIRDKSGLKDDWDWEPLDDIRIDVRIRNDLDEDLDLTVKLALVDENTGKIISDFVEDEDDLEKDTSIDEGSTKTLTFEFQISPDIAEGDYYLHVKAYEEGNEDELCKSLIAEETDNKEEINIDKENHKVIIKNVEAPSTINCESPIEVSAKLFNVGTYDEEKVAAELYNTALGIRLVKETDDLYEGDSETVSFMFSLPEDTKEGKYTFKIMTKFDYDEDDEVYDKYLDTEDFYEFDLNVLGNCGVEITAQPTINADLISEARVGEELSIEVTVVNSGNESVSYIIAPAGYEDWAEFIETSPSTLNLDAGKSGKSQIKFKPLKSGQQNFEIKIVYNGETKLQPVQVIIEEPKSGFMTGFVSGVGNTGLYIILGIIILLILIIIVLLFKSRTPRQHASDF